MTVVDWSYDLHAHELERVAATLAAVGDTLDLVTMHAEEVDAHRALYTGLSTEQRAVYHKLQRAGVLGA